MDYLRAKLAEMRARPGGNRKIYLAILALVVAIAFAINSISATSSKSATYSTGLQGHGASSSPPTTISSPSFYVHVVGEVKDPGVYSLNVGSRLFDAITAAGGFLADADQASVNLARQLSDGEQIVVLKLGAQIASSGDVGSSSSSYGASAVSLNRATEPQLESLPGVGPALANRIIDWRVANGGFKKKEDLKSVGGIGDKLFAALSKLVTL